MNKKRFYIISSTLLLIGLFAGIVQYMGMFDTLYAAASNPGHSWSEMDCDDTLCIAEDKNIGIGTMTPSQKLEINGNIKLGGEEPTYTISNIKDPTNASDLATKNYIDREIAKIGVMVSGTLPLVHSDHTQKDCVDAGGVPVDSSTELKQCKFVASTCPTGWTKNENWTTTEKGAATFGRECDYVAQGRCETSGWINSLACLTASHSWANKELDWGRAEGKRKLDYFYIAGDCYDSEVGYIGWFGSGSIYAYQVNVTSTANAKIVEIGCY